jgi:outer membrane lipoprotein-sorting protein
LVLFGVLFLCLTSQAQNNQYLTRADSDPQALALLDKLEDQLEQERLSIDFGMSVIHPAEKPFTQKGKLIQQGDKFRIITDDIQIWCDGDSRWIYSKASNEVNLYSEKEGEELSPINLISEYTGDKYVAIVSESDQVRSIPVEVIELKPVDRDSDIAKIRLSLQKDGKPVRLEIFEKSATRTVSEIYKISTPEKQADAYFIFNKADFPGVHVEDLRID